MYYAWEWTDGLSEYWPGRRKEEKELGDWSSKID
jgi:hypothetical protein